MLPATGEDPRIAERRIGIVMNGVTGRMGTNQHLVRSIAAIRAEGGVRLANGDRLMPDPVLVGRNREKLEALARAHGIARISTDLDACLADPKDELFFDAATTQLRAGLIRRAIAAGKHIYVEKPTADRLEDALDVARRAKAAGVKHGVVQDKLFLPGLRKLKLVIDSGFLGRISSVKGEFGYWVFEGDLQPAQRPSWNYKAAEGGGIVAHINSSWVTRVRRDDLATFQVDGTHGSTVAGLQKCWTQSRVNTPKPLWNPDIPQPIDFFPGWQEVPSTQDYPNGFRAQSEMFLRHLAGEVPEFPWDLMAGAKGVQLAAAGLRSWRERRWIDLEKLEA